MSVDRLGLERAVDSFMNVALPGENWAGCLAALDTALGAAGTIILPVSNRTPGPFPMSPALDDLISTYVRGGWVSRDYRQHGIGQLLRNGYVTDGGFVSPRDKGRIAYYADTVHRYGMDDFIGLRLDIGGEIACAAIQLHRGDDATAPERINALLSVAPRLSMAASIIAQMDAARLAGLSDALEAMATPAYLISRRGQVIRANAASQRLATQGLRLADGRLQIAGPDNDRFGRYLDAVLYGEDGAGGRAGLPLPIRRAQGRPLLVRAQRLRTEPAISYFSRAWAIVTISDPDQRVLARTGILREMFGLTEKEAIVVGHLVAEHGNLTGAAARAGIGYETLRTHLRHAAAKMDTNSTNATVSLAERILAAAGQSGGES